MRAFVNSLQNKIILCTSAKKRIQEIRFLICYIGLCFCICGFANPEVNVYAWSDYLPANVIAQFEKETGIKVNLSEYDSNETLYAKLRADPNIGYDIIIPSSYYVDRMRQEGMLQTIDILSFTGDHLLRKLGGERNGDDEPNRMGAIQHGIDVSRAEEPFVHHG